MHANPQKRRFERSSGTPVSIAALPGQFPKYVRDAHGHGLTLWACLRQFPNCLELYKLCYQESEQAWRKAIPLVRLWRMCSCLPYRIKLRAKHLSDNERMKLGLRIQERLPHDRQAQAVIAEAATTLGLWNCAAFAFGHLHGSAKTAKEKEICLLKQAQALVYAQENKAAIRVLEALLFSHPGNLEAQRLLMELQQATAASLSHAPSASVSA